MILKLGVEYDKAVQIITKSRKWIDINVGFEKQLRSLVPTKTPTFYLI